MKSLAFLLTLGAGTAHAVGPRHKNIFVTSYGGALSTLQLTSFGNGSYQLNNASVDLGCQPSPSELVLDKEHGSIFCIGEAAAGGNGSLTAYNLMNGTLAQRAHTETFPGPVYGVLYGQPSGSTRALALAHYGAAGVSQWKVDNTLNISPINPNITFPAPNPPGPVKESQAASHPHSTILDPTGQYVIVPDLGTDQVHVFGYDANTGALKEAGQPLKDQPGSGPRHAAFSVQGNTTYMYLVHELDASLSAYTVNYLANNGGLNFTQISRGDTLGGQKPKQKVAPAEVRISPCNKYLIVSNRNDTTFTLPNPDPKNSTAIPSDSLATYQIQQNGTLTFSQLWPAGGSFPRSMDLSQKGDMLAVGLQNDNRVVIFKRNMSTGLMDRPVAWYGTAETGQVTAVKWDEYASDSDDATLPMPLMARGEL